jgi:phosphonate transport system permease protein
VGCLAAALALIVLSYSDVLILDRYWGAGRTLATLARQAFPPDFSRWRAWARPLVDTVAMSLSGTLLSLVLAAPLGILSAPSVGPVWLRGPLRFLLRGFRAIPCLVWGIVFVAALGFGPLPGVFALAAHSTGTLGKFYGELIEHVDAVPGQALESQGVSTVGVLRFSVWPQILPRLVDVSIYRFEHNVRAATTLGAIGAGGLGLEIVTAFHLFEYREALALILVMLGLVSLIDGVGGYVRRGLLEGAST